MAQLAQLLFINCAQIVTLAGPRRPRVGREMRELSIINDGQLLVRDGRIAVVGARSEIEEAIDDEYEIVDAGGRVVLPGLVDAHTHPVFAGTRIDEFEMRATGSGYEDIARAGGGILATVGKTRAADEDQLVASGARYADWFLRNGTTTIEAKSGYGLSLADELKILRAIHRLNAETPLRYVPTFLGAHEIPPEFSGHRESYVRLLIEEMLPRVTQEKLAQFCDVFCGEDVFSLDETRRIAMAARSFGLEVRLHVDQLRLGGGAVLAAELNAKTADHLEYTDSDGIRALKAAGVQPVILPASVLMLGSTRYPAARQMIDDGLALVLATDFNPGSAPTVSLPFVMSLAATQMKMSIAESITASTINAAYSLNLGSEIGSIEVGKRADIVIHDCADYREIAYFVGVEHAHAVYRDGRLVFRKK